MNETVKIENAIIKIGTLLALGFGDAGSEIIGSNMAKTGDVDPMLPGKKNALFMAFAIFEISPMQLKYFKKVYLFL